MAINRPSAVNADEEFKQATLHEIAARMGVDLPQQAGGELRLPCYFCDAGDASGYGSLAINLDHPANLFKAHCCGETGNRLKLMYVWKHGVAPPGGKIRRDDYNDLMSLHRTFTGTLESSSQSPAATQAHQTATRDDIQAALVNVQLKDSPEERIRNLATIYERFVVDSQQMAPKAAQYVRKRPWMIEELLTEFRVGWSANQTMFRKNYLIYAHEDEDGNVLSYSGRDLFYEEKLLKWDKAGRPEGQKPIKHRFVKGFHKGQQLYGRSKRLQTRERLDAMRTHGLVIVEGMNDVLRLSALPLGVEGLCMNRATETQVATIVDDARQYAGGRIWLLPDQDQEGLAGFQELLWKLQQHKGIDARPGWPSALSHVAEPEALTDEELARILAPFLLKRPEAGAADAATS